LYFRNCTQGLPLYVHKAELCLAAVCWAGHMQKRLYCT
jgi:hypothetical protein